MKSHATPFGKGSYLAGGMTPGENFVALKRDRHVVVRSVPCPTCSVSIGVQCVNAEGAPTHQHVARRRMALRAERGAA